MYGAVYKLFNVKLVYLGAVFIFEVGSLLSAVAPNSTAFIVGRAIAGVSLFFSKAESAIVDSCRLELLVSSPVLLSSFLFPVSNRIDHEIF